MGLTLTEGQSKAFKKGIKWYKKQNKQVFRVAGYAGTGKSTIVFALIEALGLKPKSGEVLFLTYVGKATIPLRKNGLPAKTIHSALYERVVIPVKDDSGKIMFDDNGKMIVKSKFRLRDEIGHNIKLIVVDEAGMVPAVMSDDIESYGIPVIYLGDPGQLDPIFGKAKTLLSPDVLLTDIMRQKGDNPIIYLSMLAREGKNIPVGQYGSNCFVVYEDILRYSKIYTKTDIVLCGKNKTRDKINNIVRYDIKRRRSPFPVFGDKLVNRHNVWSEEIDGIALINGLFGYVTNIYDESFDGDKINIDFMPEFMPYKWFEDIPLDYEYIQMDYKERKNYNTLYANGNVFEYGYGSTIHLAQGSQYKSVLLLEEFLGNQEFQSKLIYTGITRAEETLIMVKKKPNNFYFK